MKKILIVGAGGQIGSELVPYLRNIYGAENVVATDVRECKGLADEGPFEVLDALNPTSMASAVARHGIDTIFNLVALLSAVGERNPQMAWNINMNALFNSLEVARQHHCAVFTPSSIGAFGPTSPKDMTPQDTIMQPTTIYGICKVTPRSMVSTPALSVSQASSQTRPFQVVEQPTTQWRSTTRLYARVATPAQYPRTPIWI